MNSHLFAVYAENIFNVGYKTLERDINVRDINIIKSRIQNDVIIRFLFVCVSSSLYVNF